MGADEILKRDAELRAHAAEITWISSMMGLWREGPFDGDAHVRPFTYLRAIAAAERALIEAVGAWLKSDIDGVWESEAAAADQVEQVYRALLAAMEEAQR